MSSILHVSSLGTSAREFDEILEGEKEAVIEVCHASNWFGRFRTFEVIIDGERVGNVGRKIPERYGVRPGLHSLSAKMDWCRTQTLSVCLRADDEAVFLCGMDSTFAWLMKTMIVLLIGMAGLSVSLLWLFPGPSTQVILDVCWMPVLAVGGACGLFYFARLLPWSPPGRVVHLLRLRTEPEANEFK